MQLQTEPYCWQVSDWPKAGCHILAQYDSESVVVYQAYRPAIGHFAAAHGYFGGPFRLDRMSWVKPGFLWMMYRCDWGRQEGQEVVLAIRLRRSAFDSILSQAVHSTHQSGLYSQPGATRVSDVAAWRIAVMKSDVRLQWDPDHDPLGIPIERRAIQLGLRGPVLAKYAKEWIVGVEDISGFVRDQHQYVLSGQYDKLLTPKEDVYPVDDPSLRRRLGML